MNRSDLVECLSANSKLPRRTVDLAVRVMLEHMIETLAAGERIELRGFGRFSLRYHRPRTGSNPRTGAPLTVPGKYRLYFRPGKALRKRVNSGSLEK